MFTVEYYQELERIQIAANRGTKKAIEDARNAGLPVPFYFQGRMIYQLPDGKIVDREGNEELIEEIYRKIEKERNIKCENT
jgi:hypothetical protein